MSVETAKRPIGILRYNAEVLASQGKDAAFIDKYLEQNGVTRDDILAYRTPNENELARMIESEKSGKWAQGQQKVAEANKNAEIAHETLDALREAQGAVRSFGNGLYLNWFDELESGLSGENVDKIRADQAQWSKENPTLDLALGVAGGMAPLLATGIAGPLATAGAAGKSGLARTLIGAASGAGTGAVAGLGAGTGSFQDRLDTAGTGALIGGGIGAASPMLIGGVGKAMSRIGRGIGTAPTEKEISDFMVNKIIAESGKPGAQGQRNASLLLQGIQDGSTEIQDAAKNLYRKMSAMSTRTEPTTIELAYQPNWSPQTASAQNILQGLETPSSRIAKEEFSRFAESQSPNLTAGNSIYDLVKKNKDVRSIITANKRRLGLEKVTKKEITNKLGTYDGLQNLAETLRLNMPKNLASTRIVNRTGRIQDAIDDLTSLRENLFPGQRVMNTKYGASVGGVQSEAEKEAMAYMQQLASGTPNPTNVEFSLTGASKIGLKPYVRGRAMELIKRGTLEPDTTSPIENILQKIGFGSYRTLEQQK